MTPVSSRRLVALLSVAIATAALAAAVGHTSGFTRDEDRDGDGRPDLWRVYDDSGQLVEVAIDTNFDGRSDIREYYQRGQLVRRELDRNFNGQVDLVENFDPATHEHTRSVVDVDFDGAADLLVLFQGNRAVFSKWARAGAGDAKPPARALVARSVTAGRSASEPLAPMDDPFRSDAAFNSVPVPAGPLSVVVSAAGGLLESGVDAPAPAPSSQLTIQDVGRTPFSTLLPRSPRGPPLSQS